MVEECFSKGVIIERKDDILNHALSEKVFVFTGTLQGLSRREAKQRVLSRGGKCSSSVSKNTDYVVSGPGAGSKVKKARKLEISIINEEAFLNLTND
jgi:DNA ligase (NAD+)